MKCPKCGAPMAQLFTSLACSAECDLRKPVAVAPAVQKQIRALGPYGICDRCERAAREAGEHVVRCRCHVCGGWERPAA